MVKKLEKGKIFMHSDLLEKCVITGRNNSEKCAF